MHELLDFDVAIEPLGDGFRARVVGSPAGEAYADFALPFTDKDLTILVLEVIGSIGRARQKVRRIQSKERGRLEKFGEQLFQAVFSGAVRDCLRRSRLVAESRDAGLRIRLRLPGALANVPWEYLYDAEYGFLSLSPEIALVRYVEMPVPVRPFPISPPLRILAMISAPHDVPGLEGEQEWGKLTGALADLVRAGLVEVDRLEAGTLAALQRPLRLRDYHVLHFVGHGGYDEEAQDGALALEGADRATRLVTGRDLGLMIRGHRSLRLVVLNACEGARSSRDDPFGGVAQALVRQGIPAVIAMQFEISDPAALVFSQSFYQAIADGLPVDLAMAAARVAMFAEGSEVEWATPVLYLRSPDGRVFTRGQVSETGRHAREQAERRAREEAGRQAREEAARTEAERKARPQAQREVQQEAGHGGHGPIADQPRWRPQAEPSIPAGPPPVSPLASRAAPRSPQWRRRRALVITAAISTAVIITVAPHLVAPGGPFHPGHPATSGHVLRSVTGHWSQQSGPLTLVVSRVDRLAGSLRLRMKAINNSAAAMDLSVFDNFVATDNTGRTYRASNSSLDLSVPSHGFATATVSLNQAPSMSATRLAVSFTTVYGQYAPDGGITIHGVPIPK